MSTRNIVRNIRSSTVIDGKPKLPTSNQLDFGEIAVNYAKGYETLSLKNDLGEIVSMPVNTIEDIKVNGSSVVSNKTAEITMKGNTIPVSGNQYDVTNYPSPFENKAAHISATDKVDAALKILETNISALVNEVVDNENVVSEAISKLANSAGTIDGSKNITYIKATNAHYIRNATSVHDATVKLDTNVYTIKGDVDTIKGRLNTLESTVSSLQGQIGSIPTMEFVDLGLPSGTMWATMNVGATTETDYGSYFQWGDIVDKRNANCNWASYKYCNGTYKTLTKYCTDSSYGTVDNKTTLDLEDDAARANMGGDWRMPTKDEFQELLNKTTNKWFNNYNGTGVNGMKFTSKTDTSKYIFIPASGHRSGSSFGNQGSYGYVLSSSLHILPDCAYHLKCNSASGVNTLSDGRYYGYSVRGVL